MANPKKISEEKLTEEELKEIAAGAEVYEEEVVIPEKKEEAKKIKEEFDEVIATEKDFLDLFSEKRLEIKVVYEGKLIPFKVKPIEPGDDMSFLDTDASAYLDLKDEEIKVIKKVNEGKKLNRKEQQIYNKLAKNEGGAMSSGALEMMHSLFAQHVTPPELGGDKEARKAFWVTAPFNMKMILFEAVMKALGLDQGSTIKLFRDG
jgi:hypothetical protein